MDLEDSPEEARFRKSVRAFLDANATRRDESAEPARYYEVDEAKLGLARAWQRKKAAAGFAGIRWPKQWGGQGLSSIHEVIYQQEEARYAVPKGVFDIGLGMCIPTLLAYADDAHLERYTKPALWGDEIWCQMFSEPNAGSDLAGLTTRAVRDGADWILDGQKTWTSGAQFSDFGIVLTRTDFSAPKHKGLTMFFIDMKAPGVEVRPIHQMSGASHFNEVFLSGVRVPDAQRLGEVSDGWRVAVTTLMNERLAVGEEARPDIEDIHAFLTQSDGGKAPPMAEQAVRFRFADWYVASKGVEAFRNRGLTKLSRGEMPGPELSVARIVNAEKLQQMSRYAVEMMGAGGLLLDRDNPQANNPFQLALLAAPGARIAGGTSEILRNIIAERVLGLPGDTRADKDVPFREIARGAGKSPRKGETV